MSATARQVEEPRPCPCGARKPPTLWRRGTASRTQCLRCPRCKREGMPAAGISEIVANWNAAVRAALGEPALAPEQPADWIDVDLVLVHESGLDWRMRRPDGLCLLLSKSACQVERAAPGAVVTVGLSQAYARRLGLLAAIDDQPKGTT